MVSPFPVDPVDDSHHKEIWSTWL